MIAPLRKDSTGQSIEFVQSRFLAMLPQIRRQAEWSARNLQTDAREEFVAEVIALTYREWIRLVEQGREQIARPTPLTQYASRRVRAGRRLGSRQNVMDLHSEYSGRTHSFTLERLDRPSNRSGAWRQILVEDHRAGPAETAAARLDVTAWLQTLSKRNRRIAKTLALGNTTSAVAQKFGLSAGRVSQLREWLWQDWDNFQSGRAPASCAS